MFPKTKRWMMLAAIGRAVILAMALTGGVRIGCWLFGVHLPERVAGNLFLLTVAVAGALAAHLNAKAFKRAELKATADCES